MSQNEKIDFSKETLSKDNSQISSSLVSNSPVETPSPSKRIEPLPSSQSELLNL